MLNVTLGVVFVAAFAVLLSGRVRNNSKWSAIVTPMASIIGSGFLVSVPLLASALGVWSIAAVVGLTGIAYLVGGVIRYNIRHGEPLLERAHVGHHIRSVETLSHLVLIGAYFVSVAYYLVLLATFGMKLLGMDHPLLGNVVATAIIGAICAVGATRGLEGVQRAETITVSANLAAIAALLVTLVLFGLSLPSGYSWTSVAKESHVIDWETVRFLMGLLIIVQGFETTRFMGQLYDAETRISAMRTAQRASSLIYLVFFVLMVPLFPYFTSTADVAGFIDVIDRVTPWLPYVITAGAIASQFSASVADSIGASGLITETSNKQINTNHSYILIGVVSITVIWTTDVVSVIALASRAFALFYALQCVVAVLVAREHEHRSRARGFAALALLCFAVAILGIPAAG